MVPFNPTRFTSPKDETARRFCGLKAQTQTGASDEETVKVDVLLMHESLVAGLRAKRALDHVLDQLKRTVEFRFHLWKFDLLREPELHAQALKDARRSSIVVIAVNAATELPLTVRSWLQAWTRTRVKLPRALVVSLDAATTTRSSFNAVLHYARAMAGSAGADLFPHYSETPQAGWDWTSRHNVASQPAWTPTLFPKQLPESHYAWGINE